MGRSVRWFIFLLANGLMGPADMVGYVFALDEAAEKAPGYAEAMFRISSRTGSFMSGETLLSEDVFQRICGSHASAIKATYVLNGALRNPEVSQFSIVRGQRRQIGLEGPRWLQDALTVNFPNQGEYMVVELRLPKSTPEDTVKLLDAILKAYQEEVLFVSRSHDLSRREVLDKAYIKQLQQLKQALESYSALAKELNYPVAGDDGTTQLLLIRMEVYERELLRTEQRMLKALAKKPFLFKKLLANKDEESLNSGVAERVMELSLENMESDLELQLIAASAGGVMILKEKLDSVKDDLECRSQMLSDLEIKKFEIDELKAMLSKLLQAREMASIQMIQPEQVQLLQEATWMEPTKHAEPAPRARQADGAS